MAVVYRHRRLDTNEIFYVGMGEDKHRPYDTYNRSKFWKNIFNKTDISVEIVAVDLSIDDAYELEILLISEYGRRDLKTGRLVNLSDGGEGNRGYKHTDEAKEKMINNGKKNIGIKRSDATKQKLRLSRVGIIVKKGKDNPMYGRIPHNKGMKMKEGTSKSKIVLDTSNGIFYLNAKEASKIYDIPHSTLRGMLNGNLNNKTNLIYA